MTLDPQLATQLFLTFAGALMGASLGALSSWGSSARERRLKLTLDLYAQFHSPEYNHLRILAYDALETHGGMPNTYAAASGEAKDAVATIIHFWEKVALLLRMGALDEHLLRRFLGQYAEWWSALLCEKDPHCMSDPEWGHTLGEVRWMFKKLNRGVKRSARR